MLPLADQTSDPHSGPTDAVAAIREFASRHPQAPAIVVDGRSWSYDELWKSVESLARLVATSDTDKHRPVALLLEKDARLICSMIAVVHSGRFFVVLDTHHPDARNRLVLQDADPSLILHDGQHTSLLVPGVTAIELPVGGTLPPSQERVFPAPHRDATACLLYTSGSTGTPKGVMFTRGGLDAVASVRSMGVSPGTRVSMLGSASFLGGLRTVLGGLAAGATLYPFELEKAGLDQMGQWLRSAQIEVLHTTPSVLRHLIRTVRAGERFESVRTLILVAERSLAEDIRVARMVFADRVIVWTVLGSSEVGTITAREIAFEEDPAEGQIALGPVVAGLQIKLVGDDGMPVNEGETGEIVIAGADLALGYWRQAERTATVFTPGAGSGWREFRSGDLARSTPDGSLQHMGRKDFVVKVHGVRVDLGEIEVVVAQHATVRECVVIAEPTANGDTRLVAFVQFRGDPAIEALREHIALALPPAMHPQHVVPIGDWPLTTSGKVDRRALRPPEEPSRDGDTLQGDLEKRLGGIWSEVLGETISRRDTHFLEAGGNSLNAMRIAARVGRELGKVVSPSALLSAPRLSAFAALVAAAPGISLDVTPSRDLAAETGPLSPAQEALWLLEKLEGESATYNVTLALRLTGPLDVTRLQAALGKLRGRHGAMRTVIREAGDQPTQRVLGAHSPELPPLELMNPDRVDTEPELLESLLQEARRPIRIADDQLWRARLFRLHAGDHALILVLHHIICDGWSLQVLAEDLSAIYSGREATLAAIPTRYIEVATGQRAHSLSPAADDSRAYWASRLQGLPNIELPVEGLASAVMPPDGAIERFMIPDALSDAVRAFAQRERVTPFMVQLAAFHLLLARYSGMTDFGVGIPAADRSNADLERVVGYMVNMLVMRVPLSDSLTFRELLKQVKDAVIGGLTHQDVAFERVVGDLAPLREGNRNPLFQVAFAVQNQPRGAIQFDALECQRVHTHNGASKFDLALEISPAAHGAWGEFEYRTALFDRSLITQMAGHFVQLLQSAIASPDSPAPALPFLADPDLDLLLREWNKTATTRPAAARMHELILAQCIRTPDSIAIQSDNGTLTYRQLAAQIEAGAEDLRNAGVAQGEPVGVLMGRSAQLIVTSLAIMRARGAYVPLDPTWPEQRRKAVIDTAGVRIVMHPDGIQRIPQQARRTDLQTGTELAYIIFTSGSTGTPKGVEIEHHSLCNHHWWFIDCIGISSNDVVLFRTAPTFDISLAEMLAPLVVGARIVVARDQGESDPDYLVGVIRNHGVTIHQATPSAYRLLLNADDLSRCTSLRYLAVGGEAVDARLTQDLHSALPAARIGNFYGPTETTIWATQHEVTDWSARTVPIGRPIANTRCYVLDSLSQLQPIGVWGDLFLAGECVGRGYRNRPDLTAAGFMADPFFDGERMYRTGDRVRWRLNGTLEFSGRRDGQIKIRGFRVELGEIEAVLLRNTGVASAVTLATGSAANGDSVLVAFVVPKPLVTLNSAALKDAISSSLPNYMVPGRVVIRPSLPYLASGKVDRVALLKDLAPESGSPTSAPRTKLESELQVLWGETLGVANLDVEGDFFELGGHSLLAYQLVRKIQQRLERPCTLQMLFRFPTVRQLARALAADSRANLGNVILPLQDQGNRPPVYCICGIQIYRELAGYFGPDIPVRGVFLPWEEHVLDGSGMTDELTVEEMASRYIEAIQQELPHGTFSLLGVSFGGILAYEIARQLAESGATPPIVAILDISPVEVRRRLRLTPGHAYRRVTQWVRARFNRILAGHLDAEALRARLKEDRLFIYSQAMQSYRTLPYSGRLFVVRASRRPGGINRDPALGWREFAPQVETLDVPGDHLGILSEGGAKLIARTLRQWLP